MTDVVSGALGNTPTRVDDGTTLAHLQGPGAAVRQVIAAYALRECRHIVEIGGAGMPITRFLQHTPQSVTVIDPKITPLKSETLNGQPCRVLHLAQKLQAADLDLPGDGLGVVMLGLSLKPFGGVPAVTEALIALCRRADRVVIDHSVGLARAEAQAPHLIADCGLATVFSLDLTIRDGVMEHSGHGERRLMVLQPAAPAARSA